MNLDKLIEDLEILRKYQPGALIAMHSGGLFVGNYNGTKAISPEDLAHLQSHKWVQKEDSWYLENP